MAILRTAILPNEERQQRNARNLSGEKELVRCLELVMKHPTLDCLVNPVTVRWWQSRRNATGSSPIYCSIWVTGGALSYAVSGYGKASGCIRETIALREAIESAGIELTPRLGSGEGIDAILAIGQALYPEADPRLMMCVING